MEKQGFKTLKARNFPFKYYHTDKPIISRLINYVWYMIKG